MVDLIVIGQFMGSTGTVGVATGGELSDMMTPIAIAFSAGGQIYIAQLMGARQMEKVKEAIGTFLSVMMLISVIFMVVTIVFYRGILNLLNCPEEAFSQAAAYMIISAIGMPFIFGYNAICGILRGMGESKRPLIFIIVAAIVNIGLDLLMVAAFRWEAAGTAIATVMAQIASCMAAFFYMYKRRDELGIEFKPQFFKIRKEALSVILQLGIPQAARSLLVRVSLLWVNANINAYGMTVSATNSVGNKLQKFLDLYSQGASHAASAMIGQNLGAQKKDRAKKVVMCTLYISLGIAAISVGLALGCPRALFGIFTKDADVIAYGETYLKIMIAMFILSAVTNSYQAMVTGCGAAGLNFVIGVLDGVVCKIGLSVLFAYGLGMGANGFFWGISLSRLLPAIICIIYYYSGRWARRSLVKK
jgi:putative MATE family efflux protein